MFLKGYKRDHKGTRAPIKALEDCEYVDESEGPIFVEYDACVQFGAVLKGPLYIGHGVKIAYHAVVRDGAVIMDGCRVGHASEIKGSILLPGAVSGHRNYIGDSVIGRNVNFGDASGTANLRGDRDPDKTIEITWDGASIDTGRKKLGALVGDGSSIGCRATLCPGSILGKNVLVYPNQLVVGTVPDNHEVAPAQRAKVRPRKT